MAQRRYKAEEIPQIIATRPTIGWFEVHTEIYLGSEPGPVPLDAVRREHVKSLRYLGVSLSTAEDVDGQHVLD